MSRLRRADPSLPGFTRRRAGKGFVYYDDKGRRIADIEVLERIKALVIPPAWKDVWICPWPSGHLQAVGTDAAGRRQVDRYQAGVTIAETLDSIGEDADTAASAIHGAIEEAVLALLEDAPDAMVEAA